jgi:hypothetical protein
MIVAAAVVVVVTGLIEAWLAGSLFPYAAILPLTTCLIVGLVTLRPQWWPLGLLAGMVIEIGSVAPMGRVIVSLGLIGWIASFSACRRDWWQWGWIVLVILVSVAAILAQDLLAQGALPTTAVWLHQIGATAIIGLVCFIVTLWRQHRRT